jgi:membrane protease subunit HflC
MRRILWIIGAVIVAGILIAVFTFTISETEFAVLTQFGRPVRTIQEPGLNFKWPAPVQKVNRFDKRIQLFESRLVELLTEDKKNVVLKFFVAWSIEDPMLFFQSVGNADIAEQKLDDILISKAGAAMGDYKFEDLISIEKEIKIAEIEKGVQKKLEGQTLKDYGVRIKEVEISQLALPESNAWSVYNRMRAERKAIANKYRAEGEEQASGIRAQADREKSELVSKAYKDSQVIRGEGEAQAAEIYTRAFSKDPEFYQFWRTMETYRKILDEKTTLVLSEDSELFKYLRK